MCGVTGVWFQEGSGSEAQSLLSRMTGLLRHRGPDDSGQWFDPETQVGLGHRRLSILDLSAHGRQPMESSTGRYVVSFNGEIYNFLSLRRSLEHEFGALPVKGNSDTEVLLFAIERWGLQQALQRFIGMFAFALWDRNERQLHLVRDRLGVKPLYYTATPQGLCFASELRPLRGFPGFSSELDREAVGIYAQRSYIPAPRTVFKNTFKVAPGQIATWSPTNRSSPRLTQYWSAEASAIRAKQSPFLGDFAEATGELDRLLGDAVHLRMVSDVPLGAFLSGGIDSSTVVALMQAQSTQPVRTFSIGSPNPQFDESESAAAVAKHLGTQHTSYTVSPADALAVIPDLPRIYDEPFADYSQIPTYIVARIARKSVTVALSGDGGDELFAGYNRHVWAPRIWHLQRALPLTLRRWFAKGFRSLSPEQWDHVFRLAGPMMPASSIPGVHLHKIARVLETSSFAEMYEQLLGHWDGEAPILSAGEPTAARGDALESFSEQLLLRDQTGYLPDDILTKVDRATMAVSLEAREPLLDHRLLEFAWRLPLDWKINRGVGKWILRQVLKKYVPVDLSDRPKQGFGIPLGQWLRRDLREWAEELLRPEALAAHELWNVNLIRKRWTEHLSGSRNHDQSLWNVLMFEAWRQELRA